MRLAGSCWVLPAARAAPTSLLTAVVRIPFRFSKHSREESWGFTHIQDSPLSSLASSRSRHWQSGRKLAERDLCVINSRRYQAAVKTGSVCTTLQPFAHSSVSASAVAVSGVASTGEVARMGLSEDLQKRYPKGLHVGFIGAGQMAEALARGFDKAGVVPASSMLATDLSTERLNLFKSFGVGSCAKSVEIAEKSDVIIISVKPHVVKAVLTGLRGYLKPTHLIVSIAAGITLTNLQEWSGGSPQTAVRVIRVMPNTPCLIGETASAMSVGRWAAEADAQLVTELFTAVGKIHTVDEKLLDAVTGLSGSGPAYVFIAIEALADGGVAAGLPRDVALSLAVQTVLGSAKMVLETGKHPGQLKDAVASPGGTTIAGIHELEKAGFRASLMNAVVAASNRSKELSKTS